MLLECLGWLFLLAAPVSCFERLFSGRILGVLIAPLSLVFGALIGIIILAANKTPPGAEATSLYVYWCIGVGILVLASKVFGFGQKRA